VEFVYRVSATAVGVWVATLLPGIALITASTLERIGTLLAVALVFGVVNAVVKPVAKIVGCVLYLITLGLIGLVVNALLFLLTGWLSDQIGLPFAVDGFWPAFLAAIIVSLVTFVLTIPLHLRRLGRGGRRRGHG